MFKKLKHIFSKPKKELEKTIVPQIEIPKFLSERTIEKIYPFDFPGKTFGVYTDFFTPNFDINVVLFLDKNQSRANTQYFEKHRTEIKSKLLEKGRNFVMIPNESIETTYYPYKYVVPILDENVKDFNGLALKKNYENLDKTILNYFGYKGDAQSGFLSLYEGNIVFVEKLSGESIEYFVENYIKYIGYKVQQEERINILYKVDDDSEPTAKTPQIEIDNETEEMVTDVKNKLKKLYETGQFFLIAPLVQDLLNHSLHLGEPSPIKITEDFKIILTEYHIEIEMSHLTKAVYLLFLRNHEIDLNKLPQYRNELLSIYKEISYKNSIVDIEKTVDNLVKSDNNEIYTHLSRIKSAFTKKVTPSVAFKYVVLGARNRNKQIILNRQLVIWETEI